MSWQRAIVLWFQEKVDVLEYHAEAISSPSQTLQLPSVLILKKYIRPRKQSQVRLSRQNIFLRDEYRCQYCHQFFEKKVLTIDHVKPLSKGGEHSWENVVTSCGRCNNRKADKSHESLGMKLFKKPIEPKWPLSNAIFNDLSILPDGWQFYIRWL